MSHERPSEAKLMFGVYLENGRELVLRDGAGAERRRLRLADVTLNLFSVEDVAGDLMTSVAYEMKDEQGREDTRR